MWHSLRRRRIIVAPLKLQRPCRELRVRDRRKRRLDSESGEEKETRLSSVNRLVERLDKGRLLHEGQAGFRLKRSCIDNVYTLSELVQGRLREGKTTYAFFLDVQKAYDMVWRDGLWLKLWDMGMKGRIWRVIKKMYESSRSAVLLEGEQSAAFNVEQGVAQGCSLSPILFSVFINGLLKEVEQAELGIELSNGAIIGGMLFADDFVGVSDSGEELQMLCMLTVVNGD